MFQPDEKVVYPGYGVAIVNGIVKKCVAGTSLSFIKLTFLYKDMTALVPVYNADSVGLRYVSSDENVDTALKELYKEPEKKLENIDFTPSGWNRRYKEYRLKIQGGKLIEMMKVYRDLMHVSYRKELSFGERSLLQTVEELLTQEIQSVKSIEKDDVVQCLRCPFKQIVNVSHSKLKNVQTVST